MTFPLKRPFIEYLPLCKIYSRQISQTPLVISLLNDNVCCLMVSQHCNSQVSSRKKTETNLLKIIVDVHNERSTIWGIDRKEYPNSSFQYPLRISDIIYTITFISPLTCHFHHDYISINIPIVIVIYPIISLLNDNFVVQWFLATPKIRCPPQKMDSLYVIVDFGDRTIDYLGNLWGKTVPHSDSISPSWLCTHCPLPQLVMIHPSLTHN